MVGKDDMLTMRLESARLVLRPLEMKDAPRIETLADDPAIAMNLLTMPHPYPPARQRNSLRGCGKRWQRVKVMCWRLRSSPTMI
jgi:RimJ/RimL family protein N-acetyltransferase